MYPVSVVKVNQLLMFVYSNKTHIFTYLFVLSFWSAFRCFELVTSVLFTALAT